MSASPAPSSSNPFFTKAGGTLTGSVTLADTGSNLQLNVYNNGLSGDHTDIYGGEIQVHDGNTLFLFGSYIEFPDFTIQTTAAVVPPFATTAQAQAGTSTTTVVSPATLLDAKYFQGGRNLSLVNWVASTSGTGAGSVLNQNRRDVTAPTTAIGYGVAYAFLSNATRGSSVTSSFNWAKRIQFGARLNRNVASPDANTVFRFSIGKSSQAGGDLAEKGIMIKQTAGGALQLLVHNGTTLTTTTSSFTPSNTQAYDVLIVSDGSGNATLYVNDVSVATSTGAPTTAGAINTHQINLTAENTAIITGTGMAYQVSDIFFQQNL